MENGLGSREHAGGRHDGQAALGRPRGGRVRMLAGVELPERLGVTGAPGPIVTAGGLVFLTGGGEVLYGIDKATGQELWSADLGKVGYANPMTYRTRAGRQFVVIATGSGAGTRLVAFALPES